MKKNIHITLEENVADLLKEEVPEGKRSGYINNVLQDRLLGSSFRTKEEVERRIHELKDKKERELIQRRQAETTLQNISNRIDNIEQDIKDLEDKKKQIVKEQKKKKRKERQKKERQLKKIQERLKAAEEDYNDYKSKGYSEGDKLLKNIGKNIQKLEEEKQELKKELSEYCEGMMDTDVDQNISRTRKEIDKENPET
ncbi:MAG: hypothetical protein ACLFUH_03995 [Bacteroidales bacterium]